MTITCKAINEEEYVRIIPTGILENIEDLIEYGTFMFEQGLAAETHRVLLDEKEMTDAAEASTIYEWCEHEIVEKTAAAGIRIAGVCEPENYAVNKVFETMLQNRSYNFRVFQNEEEAIQWLTS